MVFSVFNKQCSTSVQSTVALTAVQQTLLSMALLTPDGPLDKAELWLADVTTHLTATMRQTNYLIFDGLAGALATYPDAETFPVYLDALAAEDPVSLAERVKRDHTTKPDPNRDTNLQAEIEQLVADPGAMQQLIVNHLRLLWERHFAVAWENKQSMMRYIASELNTRSWPTTSADALIRAFIRKPVPEWLAGQLGSVARIIFVPSPYLYFQAARFSEQTENNARTLHIFLWADFWVWPMRTEPIQRTEVLRAISALADETRLQILEFVVAFGGLRAQEMIAQLDIGQSSVSRHLKQLVNAGFLSEERAGDANKIYRLQHERIGEVTYALSQLLSTENAHMVLTDVRLEQPAELRPFLDRAGLVTTWPAKRKGQESVLAYLITKFTVGEVYTETQVNELLMEWHTYDDPAYLRRSLVDTTLLKRTADGARYWRDQ